jgi:Cryptococcal mannosyltransferase 1
MRNRALNRLTYAYNKVFFTNDVISTAENMMDLLTRTAGGEQQYDMACGLDFGYGSWELFQEANGAYTTRISPEKSLILYDVWVSRALDGRPLLSRFPFFQDEAQAFAISNGHSAQVYTCWNGMVSINSRVFLDADIRFRSVESFSQPQSDGLTVAACEAYLIGADMWDKGFTRVFINPCV